MTLPHPVATMLQELDNAYHRLFLVVGPPFSGKTRTLRRWRPLLGAPYVNVSLSLSRRLLDVELRRRPAQAQPLLDGLLEDADLVLLDNIELLFDPFLQLDPLRALKAASRACRLIVAWPGTLDSRALRYAEPGHPEYRLYPRDEIGNLVVAAVAELQYEDEENALPRSRSVRPD